MNRDKRSAGLPQENGQRSDIEVDVVSILEADVAAEILPYKM